jgi:hypothetical protein
VGGRDHLQQRAALGVSAIHSQYAARFGIEIPKHRAEIAF